MPETAYSFELVPQNVDIDERGHLLKGHGELLAHYIDMHDDMAATVSVVAGLNNSCAMCGEYVGWQLVGRGLVAYTECTFSEGRESVIELKVPSGKLVITDDLRPTYEVDGLIDDSLPTYNSAFGQLRFIEEMAKIGCAYGPVGNSCPGVYRQTATKYVIGNPGYDEHDEPIESELGVEVAAITTDLWAYSIADHDDFVRRGGPKKNQDIEVVDVIPGTYRFTHYTTRRDFDPDAEGAVVYARFEWIHA